MSQFTRRILFAILTLAVLGLFGIAMLKDTAGQEWLGVQREFYSKYAKTAAGATRPGAGVLMGEGIAQTLLLKPHGAMPAFGIRQIQVKEFRFASGAERVDRCITCHLAINDPDPSFVNAPQPFRSHPGTYLKTHPMDTYGCTICHQGQGLATRSAAAHGYKNVREKGADGKVAMGHWNDIVEHLDQPILKGENIQAGCVKCHVGGAHAMVNAKPGKDETPVWTKGKKLFGEVGCLGCHSVAGVGGTAAPDLTEVGSKYPDQFDMRYLKGEHTVAQWVKEHFVSPQDVVHADLAIKIHFPSDMPNASQLHLTDDDVTALTVFVLSMTGEKVYAKYVLPALPEPPEPHFGSRIEHGRYLYRHLGCIGCHGKEGDESDQRKNWNAVGGVIPKLGNLPEKYSRAELSDFILRGSFPAKDDAELETPPLWMPTWRDRGLKGENLEAILDYVWTLKKKKTKAEEEF
jgi:predicted CxxxxCH...CXXCH cytochrome family protein